MIKAKINYEFWGELQNTWRKNKEDTKSSWEDFISNTFQRGVDTETKKPGPFEVAELAAEGFVRPKRVSLPIKGDSHSISTVNTYAKNSPASNSVEDVAAIFVRVGLDAAP